MMHAISFGLRPAAAPCSAPIFYKRSPSFTLWQRSRAAVPVVVSCDKQDSRAHSTHDICESVKLRLSKAQESYSRQANKHRQDVSFKEGDWVYLRIMKQRLKQVGLLQRQSSVGVVLLGLGFCIGPLLDGIHSNVQLVVYENGALNVGPLQTNLVVPPLLGVFYGIVGLSQLVLDKWFAPKDWLEKTSSKRLFFSFIFLIMILELSAEMYKAGTPYNIEAYVLFALAELNWYLFDGTWWGFGLASVVGVLCPLSEIPLMKFFDLWHYPKANVAIFDEGLVTWVLACYFAYVPFLANLSRWLNFQLKPQNYSSLSD